MDSGRNNNPIKGSSGNPMLLLAGFSKHEEDVQLTRVREFVPFFAQASARGGSTFELPGLNTQTLPSAHETSIIPLSALERATVPTLTAPLATVKVEALQSSAKSLRKKASVFYKETSESDGSDSDYRLSEESEADDSSNSESEYRSSHQKRKKIRLSVKRESSSSEQKSNKSFYSTPELSIGLALRLHAVAMRIQAREERGEVIKPSELSAMKQREEKIARFKAKKERRGFNAVPHVFLKRKEFANQRPRENGRFIKMQGVSHRKEPQVQPHDLSSEEIKFQSTQDRLLAEGKVMRMQARAKRARLDHKPTMDLAQLEQRIDTFKEKKAGRAYAEWRSQEMKRRSDQLSSMTAEQNQEERKNTKKEKTPSPSHSGGHRLFSPTTPPGGVAPSSLASLDHRPQERQSTLHAASLSDPKPRAFSPH